MQLAKKMAPILAAASLFWLSPVNAQDGSSDEAARIQAIAEEAYIYGLPIVMNYAVMYDYAVDRQSPQFKAPFNQIHNMTHVATPEDKAIISPNSDTPYSFVWMDLRAEPMVLTVPPVEKGRYYSVMLCDGNTYNFGIIGSNATQGVPGAYMVVGPDWQGETPAGIHQVFRSGTQFAMAGYRTQLFSPADMPNVEAVQAGYQAQSLSAYLQQGAAPAAAKIDFPAVNKELLKQNFFAYLDFALQFAPAAPDEQEIRARLASIGIGNGQFDRFKAIAARQHQALVAGVAAAEEKISAAVPALGKRENGWTLLFQGGGDRARYHGNWLVRAAVARAGIYALDASEAMYALTRTEADGQPLDGSRHSYSITFPAGQLPPAGAFWSLTLYDGKSQLLVANPLKRYLINSPMLPELNKNADGSLTLYIQKDSPGADQQSNWLPAPDGPIYLGLRMYVPKPAARDASWTVPPILRRD